MATTRMIVREKNCRKLAAKAFAKREALRKTIKDPHSDYDIKTAAVIALNKMPRDTSLVRCHNRCLLCGRSRGVYRKFGLCRLCLRWAFMFGFIPGVRKASW